MALEIPYAVESKIYIKIDHEDLKAIGIVRYCVRKGLNHVVGLEFTGGTRWSPEAAPGSPASAA